MKLHVTLSGADFWTFHIWSLNHNFYFYLLFRFAFTLLFQMYKCSAFDRCYIKCTFCLDILNKLSLFSERHEGYGDFILASCKLFGHVYSTFRKKNRIFMLQHIGLLTLSWNKVRNPFWVDLDDERKKSNYHLNMQHTSC